MNFAARRFWMRDGTACILRSPQPTDAAARTAFFRLVNAQTAFMARAAEDSPSDLELAADVIGEQLEDDRTMEIAAFIGDEMIACGGIAPTARAYPRKRHRATFGICVRKRAWGQGIGSEMMKNLCAEAKTMGYAQMELTVMANNHRAQSLYQRFGFEVVGRMPDAIRDEDGNSFDEIVMCKRL